MFVILGFISLRALLLGYFGLRDLPAGARSRSTSARCSRATAPSSRSAPPASATDRRARSAVPVRHLSLCRGAAGQGRRAARDDRRPRGRGLRGRRHGLFAERAAAAALARPEADHDGRRRARRARPVHRRRRSVVAGAGRWPSPRWAAASTCCTPASRSMSPSSRRRRAARRSRSTRSRSSSAAASARALRHRPRATRRAGHAVDRRRRAWC